MSYEIHALERAKAMMYDKKKELSIRDEIKKRDKKIKHKKTTEVFENITPEKVRKSVTKSVVAPVKRIVKKDIVTPVKQVIKKAPEIEKKAVATVKKTVSRTVVAPVKRVIKKDISLESLPKIKEEKHSKKDHKKKHKK